MHGVLLRIWVITIKTTTTTTNFNKQKAIGSTCRTKSGAIVIIGIKSSQFEFQSQCLVINERVFITQLFMDYGKLSFLL